MLKMFKSDFMCIYLKMQTYVVRLKRFKQTFRFVHSLKELLACSGKSDKLTRVETCSVCFVAPPLPRTFSSCVLGADGRAREIELGLGPICPTSRDASAGTVEEGVRKMIDNIGAV